MSYDIELKSPLCDACGHRADTPEWNPTYNLTDIFDYALTGEDLPNPEVTEFAVVILKKETSRPRGMRILNGMVARDSIELLEKAFTRIHDPSLEAKFNSLAPSNGWGDLAGARMLFGQWLTAAKEHPLAIWEIQ